MNSPSELGHTYLSACLMAHKAGHWPSHPRTGPGLTVQTAAQDFIAAFGPAMFSGFLQEFQYAVNLWTAHIIVEQKLGDEALRAECWEDIHRYAKGALDEGLRASEEDG